MVNLKLDKPPLVVALGGNALNEFASDELDASLGRLCTVLARHAHQGLVITHGNGPQIGYLDALQQASTTSQITGQDPAHRPLDVLGAESEGWLGYEIQRCMANALQRADAAVTVLSFMEVDARDKAFANPDKPIGPCYDARQARQLSAEHGWQFRCQDSRYQRVVPSPRPLACPQLPAIAALLAQGQVVICAGGGGIPVLRNNEGDLQGVEAVIDKDRASALLAQELGAERLILATNIDGVYRHWPRQENDYPLQDTDAEELAGLSLEAGSMGPKVAAACQFARQQRRPAVIGALEQLEQLLDCRAGTVVHPAAHCGSDQAIEESGS
ncbi:MAG: carbamate kinase [Pseudomonadales bacterium]|nr:carbamate kinase [Pseudomonadales bacterium]